MNQLSVNSVEAVTLLELALPFIVGFLCYLLPRLDRLLATGVALASLGYGLSRLSALSLTLNLIDQVGVTLVVDTLSGFFILTNAVVTLALVLYSWRSDKSAFFFTQLIILHSSVNGIFVCADLISLYVALEVISISTFLLITYPRSHRSIWVGLRYLFVSNTAMLFYLIGAVLVYQTHQTFAFSGLEQAPVEAIALLGLGVLTKGGIFLSGLWLPLTHAEAETGVSALLSGAVITAGVFPLVRWGMLVPELQTPLSVIAVGSALLGVGYAVVETDTKRLLAFSTISQLGFVLVAPTVAGFYGLTHGLAKAALFLLVGNLSSRDLPTLQRTPMRLALWLPITLAALSMSGVPPLGGFGSKVLTLKGLESSWQGLVMNGVALGTAIAMTKLICLPVDFTSRPAPDQPKKLGLWLAISLLLGSLVIANLVYPQAYTLSSAVKALITLGGGGLIYWVGIRPARIRLPRVWERLKHLIGLMTLLLSSLFWMVAL